MQTCPSGAFPKVLGTASINDCFTEIKQVDVDEKNDRLVAVGLSDIVGLTQKDKNDNKKPIILMMKLTNDGSNSQKINWGFRFEGGVKSSFIGQVAFSSNYTKVVAVSYDIAQISCNEVKQDKAKIMVFDALNGQILNKRYYYQYSSCDELKDFYQRLILVTEDHVYMALRGSIIQSNKNYSRAFNVFKLSLTDGTSSPLSVTGIKINSNQLFSAAPLGITMGSSDSTLFLLAYDYNQQKFIVSRISTQDDTPWTTQNKLLNYNNARIYNNYINYKEYQDSPKGLLLIVGSIVMKNSSIKKIISTFKIDASGQFGLVESHLIISHEYSLDNYVLTGVQMVKENCFFMLLLERNDGKQISFNRFHLAYVNLITKSVTYFATLPSFPFSVKLVYSSATFSQKKPGIFYFAASVESQIFKEGIGLSPITLKVKGQQSAIVTNDQTNNCQMINPWASTSNPRDLKEDNFEEVAASVNINQSNLYIGTSISLKVVDSTDIKMTDIKVPAQAVINIDAQCSVHVKEIPGTYTFVEPLLKEFNVQLTESVSCVSAFEVPSPIDISSLSSYSTCPTSITYSLELSVTPSLPFLANPTYIQDSNTIKVCIKSPNSPSINDLTYKVTVSQTKQSREVRVRLTGVSSQYIKFDTAPLNKIVMDAYTNAYLTLPLILADQMPQRVELLTYDKPRWVTIQKLIEDKQPTVLINPGPTTQTTNPPPPSQTINKIILYFNQPDPPETTEFVFFIALQYIHSSTLAPITSPKYKLKVTVRNTNQAPIFQGILTDKKLLGWIVVEVGKVKSFQMPNITDETPKQVEIELGILNKNVQLDWVTTINTSVIITPTDLKLRGLHTITITLRDAHKNSTYLLQVKVTTPINTGSPLFSPSLSFLDLRISLGSNFTYELPLTIDPDPTDVTPQIQLISLDPDLKPYVTFTAPTTLHFNLPPSVPLSGKIFQLTFSASDQSPFGPLTSQDTLYVKVYTPNTPSPPSSPPPARVYVEQPAPAMHSAKKPQSKLVRPLRVAVKQMTSQGVLTLRYSDKIMSTSVIDETIILLKVREGVTDKEGVIENKTIVRWNVTRVGDREQEFAIEFAEPGEISNDKVKDTLEIKFLRNETLLRVEDMMGLPINHTITYIIPQQVKQTKSILLMGKAADAASKSLTYALVSNAILQIFLSFSMQLVWGLMNTLQLISYTLKLSLIVPANLFTYFEVINEFLSMKAQFIQKWVDWLMEKVGILGAEGDENVLKNMETLLIGLIAIVILILLTLVIKLFIDRVQCIRTIYEALKKKLFWNSLLRFGIQSYLKMTHLALVSTHSLSFSDKPKVINSVSAIAMLTFAAGFPIFTHWFLKTRRAMLQTTEYSLSFNSLYLTLETELRASSIWYTTLFLVRRLILAITVAFLGSGQGFQVAITEVTGMALLVYIIRVKPMNRPILNWIEIYNELTFLTTTILMKSLTDYTPDFSTTKQQEKETRENMGWVIIGVTSLYIVINLIFIVHGILHSLWQKLVPLARKLSARYCPSKKVKKGGAETYNMNRDISNLSQSQIHMHENQSSFYEHPAASILDDVQVEDFEGQNVDFPKQNQEKPRPAGKKGCVKKDKPAIVEKAVHIRDLRSNVLKTYKPSEEFKQGDPIAKESRYQEISKFAGDATTLQTGYTDHLDRLKQFVEKSKRPDQPGFIMQIPQTFAPQPLRQPQQSLKDYLESSAFTQAQAPTVEE